MNESIVCYACRFPLGTVLSQETEDRFGFGPYGDLSSQLRIRLYFRKGRLVVDKISLVCPYCGRSTFLNDDNVPKRLVENMLSLEQKRRQKIRELSRECTRCGIEVPRGNICPNCGARIQFYT